MNGEEKVPKSVPPEMLHIDGDTLWIGHDYEHATAIFNRRQHDGVVRIIHIDRSDPQQRRCTAFLDAAALAEWFAAPAETGAEQP